MIDKSTYHRVIQVGAPRTIIRILKKELEVFFSFDDLDHKIKARIHTKWKRPRQPSGFKFTEKFFAKLSLMPSFAIHVAESRSQIRKTCFGFRDKRTGERVYLRIDPGSVVEFRDSPAGFIIGTRYIVPGLDRMRPPRWDKVNRKMTRHLSQRGIIVYSRQVKDYLKSINARYKLARKLVRDRTDTLRWRLNITRRQYEKAIK